MKVKECTFSSGGERIDGTIYFPEGKGKFPGVVIYHGLGSRKDRYTDRAQVLAKNGIVTLNFSFRGCGKSGGDFKVQTVRNGMQDALSGFYHLTSYTEIDKEKIGVYGGSCGGYLAALITEKRPVKSLILSAPAIYKDEWWDRSAESIAYETSEYRHSGENFNTKAITAIKNYPGSLLVIKHEKDEVIPERVTNAYFNQATSVQKKKMHVIKNAKHSLHDQKFRNESNKITAEWFKETLVS